MFSISNYCCYNTYVHTYIRTHRSPYTYIYAYLRREAYIHIYIHAYIHTYIQRSTDIHTCICTHIGLYPSIHPFIHPSIHTEAYIHTFIHAYVLTYQLHLLSDIGMILHIQRNDDNNEEFPTVNNPSTPSRWLTEHCCCSCSCCCFCCCCCCSSFSSSSTTPLCDLQGRLGVKKTTTVSHFLVFFFLFFDSTGTNKTYTVRKQTPTIAVWLWNRAKCAVHGWWDPFHAVENLSSGWLHHHHRHTSCSAYLCCSNNSPRRGQPGPRGKPREQ